MTATNPLKGEIGFELEDGRAFVAVFDIDAICAIEDLRDRPLVQIMAQVIQGRVSFVRDALWAGLRRRHPQVTVAQVGEILTQIKGKKAAEIVLEGVQAAFPAPKASEGDTESPREALGADGTGNAS